MEIPVETPVGLGFCDWCMAAAGLAADPRPDGRGAGAEKVMAVMAARSRCRGWLGLPLKANAAPSARPWTSAAAPAPASLSRRKGHPAAP